MSSKILIVDDNPNVLRLLNISLTKSKANYNVIEAENGEQAFELANREKPDLIISDIMMPQMDGIELCWMIRENSDIPLVPFIFLTSFEDPETENLWVEVEDTNTAQLDQVEHDLLVICPGLQPPVGLDTIAKALNLTQSSDGYLDIEDSFLAPVETPVEGVFTCGCADGPKDIPDSVTAGSAAAMRATIILSKAGEKK